MRIATLILMNTLMFFLLVFSSAGLCRDDLKADVTVETKQLTSRINEFAEQYLLNIETLESQEGAYGASVSEELLSLGTFYQQHGKHRQAIKVFKRSLHLKRINEGLYTLGQVPIVQRLIESFLEQKEWRSADQRFKYLNWLYQRNYTDDALELYPFKMQMASWYLKSFSLNRLKEPAVDLLRSHIGYMQAIDIMTKAYGPYDLRLISSIRGSLLVNYLIATANLRVSNLEVSDSGNISGGLNGIITKMGHLKNKSLKQGISLINQEIDIYQAQAKVNYHSVTASKLKLADWYLMYGKRDTAMQRYQEAYQYLSEHIQDGQVIEQTFAKTVILPNFENMDIGASVISSDNKPTADHDYIHASLDVTRFGTAKNVKIVDTNLTSNAKRSKVLRTIRKAKYRPRIADGHIIASAQVQLHIVP
jgi:tetratricopeptide (TPR) repeat protein